MREVRYDGAGTFQIRFAFDRSLVELSKGLPTRRWNATERYWSVPEQHVVQMVELLRPQEFRFDAATREFYRISGACTPQGSLDIGMISCASFAGRSR